MESISTILFSLYKGTPQHAEWLLACLQGAWPGLIGDKIANACRPISLRGPELIVQVTDSAWLPALTSMKRDLLQRIARATGNEVKKLSFVREKVH